MEVREGRKVNMELDRILQGDCIDGMKTMPDRCVNMIVTSPPYYGLRDYGTAEWVGGNSECDHKEKEARNDGGRVNTNGFHGSSKDDSDKGAMNYRNICGKCGAVRVDGQIGLEDTPEAYVQKLVDVFRECRRILKDDGTLWLNLGDSYAGNNSRASNNGRAGFGNERECIANRISGDLKSKDLIGIPWMVAFALRADGWYLRQDIIWCLSGGTYIYVKTQKGVYPMMVRDMVRLEPSTVSLWNGERWTRVLGWSKSNRTGNEIEIVLRSGERISCTKDHKFPTNRGLIIAEELLSGDELLRVVLPEPENVKDCYIDGDAAWLAGLYIAEGSMAGDTIQIAGHSKETERWERLKIIASKYGGNITRTISGNKMDIRLYGKILVAIINELVSGKTSKNKCFAPVVWQYSNSFIASMINGYLSGDGYWDAENNRWRLGFARNYNLERDLRTASARLGYYIVMKLSTSNFKGKKFKTFRGELRFSKSDHHNNKNENEIVEIRKARCREVYDIGIEDEPHTYALASGILTHNSKPNPMPESVTDRCTKAHEYIFLLSKSNKYYYDANAIKEPAIVRYKSTSFIPNSEKDKASISRTSATTASVNGRTDEINTIRNKRSVWNVSTKPFKEAHFATFPIDLIEPCVLAGCPQGGTVFDPFMGAGTTALCALKNDRHYLGCELSKDYIDIAEKRISDYKAGLTLKLFEEE